MYWGERVQYNPSSYRFKFLQALHTSKAFTVYSNNNNHHHHPRSWVTTHRALNSLYFRYQDNPEKYKIFFAFLFHATDVLHYTYSTYLYFSGQFVAEISPDFFLSHMGHVWWSLPWTNMKLHSFGKKKENKLQEIIVQFVRKKSDALSDPSNILGATITSQWMHCHVSIKVKKKSQQLWNYVVKVCITANTHFNIRHALLMSRWILDSAQTTTCFYVLVVQAAYLCQAQILDPWSEQCSTLFSCILFRKC